MPCGGAVFPDTAPRFGLVSRRGLFLGAAAIVIAPAGAAPPTDVAGWANTRWGMSRAELGAALGASLVSLKTPLVYGKFVARDTLPGLRLAGRPFVAIFQFDPSIERLAQVLLRYRGDFPMPADFIALRDLLAAEYGPPAERRNEKDYSGSFPSFRLESRWRFPSTEIALSLTDPDAEPLSGRRKTLVARYWPAQRG